MSIVYLKTKHSLETLASWKPVALENLSVLNWVIVLWKLEAINVVSTFYIYRVLVS